MKQITAVGCVAFANRRWVESGDFSELCRQIDQDLGIERLCQHGVTEAVHALPIGRMKGPVDGKGNLLMTERSEIIHRLTHAAGIVHADIVHIDGNVAQYLDDGHTPRG